MDEQVLCFPASKLDELGRFQGFSTDEKYMQLLDGDLLYIPRSQAENDEKYKQIIPYVMFCYEGYYFTYQRTKKTGDSRLFDLYSLGIGGHISKDLDDHVDKKELYHRGLMRELREEVELSSYHKGTISGFINNDENPIGKVHFGILHRVGLFTYDALNISLKEDSLTNNKWMSISELKSNEDKFEAWSKIIIDHLINKQVSYTSIMSED